MPRLLLLLLLSIHVPTLLAGDVLASGNSFNPSNANFSANLARLGHTFEFVAQNDFAATSLNGFTAVWLDGFSDFAGLSTAALTNFVEAGGVLLVQAPGFGSQSRDTWPGGDSFGNAFTEPDFENTIRIQAPNNPVLQGVSNESLSNWDVSAVGLLSLNNADFTGLADNGSDGNWVIIYRQMGAGFLIYTNQPFGTRLQAGAY